MQQLMEGREQREKSPNNQYLARVLYVDQLMKAVGWCISFYVYTVLYRASLYCVYTAQCSVNRNHLRIESKGIPAL